MDEFKKAADFTDETRINGNVASRSRMHRSSGLHSTFIRRNGRVKSVFRPWLISIDRAL